jgi:hypothetical protein
MMRTLFGRARGHWRAQSRFDVPTRGSEPHRIASSGRRIFGGPTPSRLCDSHGAVLVAGNGGMVRFLFMALVILGLIGLATILAFVLR